MTKLLHIISFNVPYPPNYGGVIEVYHKIEALAKQGVKIYLHNFEYDRPPAPQLEALCEQVYYYPRTKNWKEQLSLKPFIVRTRNHPQLLKNLSEVCAPILFEGIHSCYFLDHPQLKAYSKLVRTHNIEHYYYFNLYKNEKNLSKRYYYLLEALRLWRFEQKLKKASQIFAISNSETQYFANRYGQTTYLPAFHPFEKQETEPGLGRYLLFHGNLSVNENQQALRYLIKKVFSQITVSFTIAGKNPPDWLRRQVQDIPHISLVEDPSLDSMQKLIREAQICIIPTFQVSGIKLKLLSSLYAGRHVLTNSMMVQGTNLKEICHIADSPVEMLQAIQKLMELPLDAESLKRRRQLLETHYSNEVNAQKIIDLL